MKKLFIVLLLIMLVIAGCGTNKLKVQVDKAPDFVEGKPSEFIVKVTDGDEAITGLSITATLEMSKMDHGVIEVSFEDIGNGLYKSEVELAMGGEWIADIQAESDSGIVDKVVTFQVKER